MKELHFRDLGVTDLEPVSCYIKKFYPSFYMGMHSHVYFEAMYASKGNFIIEFMKPAAEEGTVGEVFSVIVRQGELIFIDACVFHRLKIEEDEVSIYNIELRPRPADEEILNIAPVNYASLIEYTSLKKLAGNTSGYMVIPNLSRIDIAFRELISNMTESNTVEDACCVRSRLLILFMEIAKSLTLLEQNNIHYVKKIHLYIKHHLNEKISLDDIAREVGYHKSYLASQFRKYTGRTIMQTVNEMRVSTSLRLLRDTSFSVSEIAKRVGFPSYAQMVHEFNRQLKLSPTACRKIFLQDETDYNTPEYSSISIRINEEDFLLNDDKFNNAFYKKNLNPKSKELFGY